MRYRAPNALADKFCAMLELHDGRPSSRVKDLVDVLIYATTCVINGDRLMKGIKQETGARRMRLVESFVLPKEWEGSYDRQFVKLRAQTGLSDSYASIADAFRLAAKLFNPVLSGEAKGLSWSPVELEWV